MNERLSVSAEVPSEATGVRIDRFLAERLELFHRSQIPHRDVRVTIAGHEVKLSRRLRGGETLEISYTDPEPAAITAEEIALDIIYENADVIVINKPAGMVVHPAAGNWSGTLVQGLMHHVAGLASEFDDRARPGIVHRLDKDTSGVIIAAKHPGALDALSAQFKSRKAGKHYLALVKGRLPRSRGTIDAAIGRDPRNRKRFAIARSGGKSAVTEYRVLRHYRDYSFVSLRPRTGRTHQLRVHLASVGTPILGDPVYARPDARFPATGLMLHAYQLTITLPGDTEPRTFTARLPERFRRVLRAVSDLP